MYYDDVLAVKTSSTFCQEIFELLLPFSEKAFESKGLIFYELIINRKFQYFKLS